jgi:hypothetical protein
MWAGPLGLSNLDVMAEWIRVEPYTYTHWDYDTRFSNSGSVLGAQIGPNATSLWTDLRWTPTSKWTISLSEQFIERGENIYDSAGTMLYNAGADWTIPENDQTVKNKTNLLNGRRVNTLTLGLDLAFEPWRGLVVFARGTKKSVNYLDQPPTTPGVTLDPTRISFAPRELPETIIAIGARALF